MIDKAKNKIIKMVDNSTIDEFEAKKDFKILQNEEFYELKKGNKYKNVPRRFLENLITEEVIDLKNPNQKKGGVK